MPSPRATDAAAAADRRPEGSSLGVLDRLLKIFSEVRPGEGLGALLLMLDVFLLLAGYYLLKTVREPLILGVAKSGAEYKAYSGAAIAVLLMGLVPAYSALASRVSRVKLISTVTLFFILCLLGFFAWAQAIGAGGLTGSESDASATAAAASGGRLALGVAFFIWVGIFNVMIIAQAWAFANDLYTVDQGKRLFPVIMLGASLGAIFGAYATKPLIHAMGVRGLMLVAAVALALTLLVTWAANARARRTPRLALAKPEIEPERTSEGEPTDEEIHGRSGFALVFTDRYLLVIALLTLLINLVNTTGEYILAQRVAEIAKQQVAAGALPAGGEDSWIGLFYGSYFFWVNILSAVLQAFLVSRVIRWIGVRGSLVVVPVVSLLGYAALAFTPLLALIRIVKTAENSLDYSLENTTRHSLFLPTSRAAKYKAKQATDSFFWRFGDLLSAGLVFAGVTWLGFATRQFALMNAALVLFWLVGAFIAGREFSRRAQTK